MSKLRYAFFNHGFDLGLTKSDIEAATIPGLDAWDTCVKVITEVKKSLQFEITVHGCTGFYGFKKGKDPKTVFNSPEELDQYTKQQ